MDIVFIAYINEMQIIGFTNERFRVFIAFLLVRTVFPLHFRFFVGTIFVELTIIIFFQIKYSCASFVSGKRLLDLKPTELCVMEK